MQILEIHFNPKLREDSVFETFIHEPENSSERKLGSMYMAGELKNTVFPKGSEFLANLSKTIKKSYYLQTDKEPEKALLKALKKANDHLAEEIKNENVSWLGNFNFAALSFKKADLSFTASGNIKIILIRNREFIDIGQNLDFKEIEPYPLKVFFNTASGKLAENDILLVTNKEIYKFLKQRGALNNLAKSSNLTASKVKKLIPQNDLTGPLLVFSFENLDEKKAVSSKVIIKKDDEIKIPAIVEKLQEEKKPRNKIIALILIASVVLAFAIGFMALKIFSNKKVVKIEDKIPRVEGLAEITDFPKPNSGIDANGNLFAYYFSNLYTLNPQNCKITKANKDWPVDNASACQKPKSIAIDGSVWILNGDNSVLRYYAGKFKEKIQILGNPLKIETNTDVPYLYFLEPNKITITQKDGALVKEIKGAEFNDLKDFSISADGKILYVLNGSQAYSISL